MTVGTLKKILENLDDEKVVSLEVIWDAENDIFFQKDAAGARIEEDKVVMISQ